MSDMEALPKGWQQTALSDVCTITMGQSPSSRDINNEGKGLPFYQGKTEFTDVYPSVNRYCEVPLRVALQNDILMSVRAPVGPVNIAKDKSGFGRGLCSIQCEYGIEHKYMFFQLRAMESHIASLGTGSTFTAINRDIVEGLSVNIAPEKEQTRIVEKLEELLSDLDNGAAELNKAQTKLGLYRQSLLKSAVEGQLTQQWREQNRDTNTETGQQLLERILKERRQRWEAQKLAEFAEKEKIPPKNWQSKYPEPAVPDTSKLPELPEGWVWASIDQLALNKRYGSSSKTNDNSTGVPVLRMGNIQDGELDYDNLKYLPTVHNEFPGLYLNDGDLLFNRTNSAELVGKTAIYRDIGKPCSYASYLIAVTFTDNFKPELAAYFINSVLGKAWLTSVMNQTAGQANVNGTKLGALAIPLPPSAEQIVIVDQVTALQDQLHQQALATEIGIKQAVAQRKNILKSAFSGKLVPQNPVDEPASVLLEKIKAERAAKPKPTKSKRTKKLANMKPISRESLKKWVVGLKTDSFDFEELSKEFSGDYETLKEVVFLELADESPLIEQYFESESSRIKFKKVKA